MSGHIAIKGTRNGLLLTLEPDTPFNEILSALADRLAESPSFFRGASLTIDSSQRALRLSERMQLEDLLAIYQMSVAPVEQSSTTEQRHRTKTIVLPLTNPLPILDEKTHHHLTQSSTRQLEKPYYAHEQNQFANEKTVTQDTNHSSTRRDMRESDDTLFIRRTVRSGQAIHHGSNVVILGDVNPGAEIIAGGDIIVWGVLRGMVHAGYPDNESALVCSLQLAPVQLRIAHLLSRPPEGFEVQAQPEVASIRRGQIVVETWVGGRPPRNK